MRVARRCVTDLVGAAFMRPCVISRPAMCKPSIVRVTLAVTRARCACACVSPIIRSVNGPIARDDPSYLRTRVTRTMAHLHHATCFTLYSRAHKCCPYWQANATRIVFMPGWWRKPPWVDNTKMMFPPSLRGFIPKQSSYFIKSATYTPTGLTSC